MLDQGVQQEAMAGVASNRGGMGVQGGATLPATLAKNVNQQIASQYPSIFGQAAGLTMHKGPLSEFTTMSEFNAVSKMVSDISIRKGVRSSERQSTAGRSITVLVTYDVCCSDGLAVTSLT